MEHGAREGIVELDDVAMGDIVGKLVGVLRPAFIPKTCNVAARDGRHGAFSVPIVEGLLQKFEDFFLRWEDLVL